jgi:hypothetical protein
MPALLFGPYTEAIRFECNCGGTATYIGILKDTCSENTVVVFDTWYTVHAMVLGSPVLMGIVLVRDFFSPGNVSFGADFARQRNPTATESSMVKKALAGGSLQFWRIPVMRGDPSNFPTFKCCTTVVRM